MVGIEKAGDPLVSPRRPQLAHPRHQIGVGVDEEAIQFAAQTGAKKAVAAVYVLDVQYR